VVTTNSASSTTHCSTEEYDLMSQQSTTLSAAVEISKQQAIDPMVTLGLLLIWRRVSKGSGKTKKEVVSEFLCNIILSSEELLGVKKFIKQPLCKLQLPESNLFLF
jgi:hypothetical protein